MMRPVQASVLILNAFPWHIEALAIANLLAYQRGPLPKHENSSNKSSEEHYDSVPSVALSLLGSPTVPI